MVEIRKGQVVGFLDTIMSDRVGGGWSNGLRGKEGFLVNMYDRVGLG